MKSHILMIILLINIPFGTIQAENTTVNELLRDYEKQGASAADAEQGKQLWQKAFNNNGERSCASCHTKDLTKNGKHIKTSKDIKPMSPSVNPERLTDGKKINKWFNRNCKWTLGRECTAQEKTNFLVYIEESVKF
jgi:mono/diheme cytochrome c family protein